jgi:hypothetical protein
LKRRRSSQEAGSILGLDSLMDVVTNMIGALFFVIIYAVLSSFNLTGTINTPVAAISDTRPVIAECRNNTIFFPDNNKMIDETYEFLEKRGKLSDQEWRRVVDEFNKTNINNKFYALRLEIIPKEDKFSAGFILEPIREARGEDEMEITQETSQFQQSLSRLNPKEQHVFFYVREDSISIFHLARKLVTQKGFKVGWEPFKLSQSLEGRSGGAGFGNSLDPQITQ